MAMHCVSVMHSRDLLGPTQAKEVWKNRYNEDVYKLFDDVALSTPEQTSVSWPLNKRRTSIPHKEKGGYFGGSRAVGKPRAWACKGPRLLLWTVSLAARWKMTMSGIPDFCNIHKITNAARRLHNAT